MQQQISPTDFCEIETLEIVAGADLISCLSSKTDMTDRLDRIRHEIALDTALVLPNIFVRESSCLEKTEYEFLINGKTVVKTNIYAGRYLAFDPGDVTETVNGIEAVDPIFETSALWIEETQKEQAIDVGYIVIDTAEIIFKHFEETIRKHVEQMLVSTV